MTEQELLLDCLRRLNRAEITYYLTGSMASNYWGIPRTHARSGFRHVQKEVRGDIVVAFRLATFWSRPGAMIVRELKG